jgi:hypothetical protein
MYVNCSAQSYVLFVLVLQFYQHSPNPIYIKLVFVLRVGWEETIERVKIRSILQEPGQLSQNGG